MIGGPLDRSQLIEVCFPFSRCGADDACARVSGVERIALLIRSGGGFPGDDTIS
jgi:hypothetical protein